MPEVLQLHILIIFKCRLQTKSVHALIIQSNNYIVFNEPPYASLRQRGLGWGNFPAVKFRLVSVRGPKIEALPRLSRVIRLVKLNINSIRSRNDFGICNFRMIILLPAPS